MDEIAIKIEHVSKEYRLGTIGGGTLRGDLQSWWAKKRGREDPNSKLGSSGYTGEKFLALDDVSFAVRKGEAVGIIGHNGAGKSTLLKLLSRVTAPTSGTISYNGRIASMLEVGTGFHPELTGRENVYMNGAILGMTKAEIDKKFDEIVAFAEMEKFIDTPVKRYSSGMYVKLAFSVAAHLDSEIMVMDEVLAVGDMKFQKKCLAKMREAADVAGRTVLYVSHNMNTIRQLCDRCVVMDHGKVIFDGDVEQAISIYMNAGYSDDFPVSYDYTHSVRRHHFGQQLFVSQFSFCGTSRAEFHRNDNITFKIAYHASSSLQDLRFVMRIRDHDNVQKIAACISEPFDTFAGDYSVCFSMNLGHLAEDKYCLSFEIVSFDTAGNYYSYDNPDAIIPILISSANADDINWSINFWGSVQLPAIKMLSSE